MGDLESGQVEGQEKPRVKRGPGRPLANTAKPRPEQLATLSEREKRAAMYRWQRYRAVSSGKWKTLGDKTVEEILRLSAGTILRALWNEEIPLILRAELASRFILRKLPQKVDVATTGIMQQVVQVYLPKEGAEVDASRTIEAGRAEADSVAPKLEAAGDVPPTDQPGSL